MAAPRKLPDNTVLRQLRAQGWKLKRIAEEYDVTEAAVWKALERAGFTETKETYQDHIPWPIHPIHRSTAVAQRLRAIMRQKKGQVLNPTEQHLLDTWLQAMKDADVVLDYHPEAPPNDASRKGGFFYVKREPTDEGIFRLPKVPLKKKAKPILTPEPSSGMTERIVPPAVVEQLLTGPILN